MADVALANRLEQQFPGFRASFGGEELKRATAALSGALGGGSKLHLQGTPSKQQQEQQDGAKGQAAASAIAAVLSQTSRWSEVSEGDLQLRELALAANQYASIEATAGPGSSDYDVLYNHGLVLQELAGRLPQNPHEQLALLRQACELYAGAAAQRPSSYGAMYNWGVALSDMARLLKELQAHQQQQQQQQQQQLQQQAHQQQQPQQQQADADKEQAQGRQPSVTAAGGAGAGAGAGVGPGTGAGAGSSYQREALECLQQASHKYAESLDLQPGNPQALNNWGLVLQELSAHAGSVSERDQLVGFALEKFRHAVRLRPDFDRGCYNLGTVLYTYACALQADLTAQLKAGRLTSQDAETSRERNAREARVRSLFTCAAQYICLSYALQQGKDIYRRSLSVVKHMLPLPFLRAGYLTAPVAATLGGPGEAWRREWFVLDHASLRSASAMESSLSTAGAAGGLATSGLQLRIGHAVGEVPLVIPLTSIVAVRRCFDPSLPEGEALWLQLSHPLDRPAASPTTSSTPTSTAGPSTGPSPAQPHTHYHHHTATTPHASAHGGTSLQSAASAQSHQSQPQAAGDWASTVVRAASGRLAPLQEGHLPGFSSSTGHDDYLEHEEGYQRYQQQQQQQEQAELVEQLCSVECAPPCCCVWLVADGADSADAWVDALLLARHVVGSRSEGVLAEALTPAAAGHVAAAVGRLSSDAGRR